MTISRDEIFFHILCPYKNNISKEQLGKLRIIKAWGSFYLKHPLPVNGANLGRYVKICQNRNQTKILKIKNWKIFMLRLTKNKIYFIFLVGRDWRGNNREWTERFPFACIVATVLDIFELQTNYNSIMHF